MCSSVFEHHQIFISIKNRAKTIKPLIAVETSCRKDKTDDVYNEHSLLCCNISRREQTPWDVTNFDQIFPWGMHTGAVPLVCMKCELNSLKRTAESRQYFSACVSHNRLLKHYPNLLLVDFSAPRWECSREFLKMMFLMWFSFCQRDLYVYTGNQWASKYHMAQPAILLIGVIMKSFDSSEACVEKF